MSQSTQTPGWGLTTPPRRKRRIGKLGWVGIALAVFATWGIIASQSGGTPTDATAISTPATTPAPQSSADTTPAIGAVATNTFPATTAAKPKPPPKPKTVLAISGTGSHTHATRQFTIPDNWHWAVRWSYRASGLFAGDSVNFILDARAPDDGGIGDTLVNELDTRGSGVEELGGSGAYWLSIISESAWTLKVVQVPDGCLTDSPPSCP
jgi:hypothetical protein